MEVEFNFLLIKAFVLFLGVDFKLSLRRDVSFNLDFKSLMMVSFSLITDFCSVTIWIISNIL